MTLIQQDTDKRLDQLRALLLDEEALARQGLQKDVSQIKQILLEEEQLSDHLKPHFEDNVRYLKENFPNLFGRYLGESIKLQIREAQDEMIDALYPIIGKLIAQYIKVEFRRISQQIDARLADPFSLKNLKLRWKAFRAGVSFKEMLIKEGQLAQIKEVFVIEKESGLLLGHYSTTNISHPDMVAGMLKGLQQFSEHALESDPEELEKIEYDRHIFHLFHYQTHTFAVIIDGEADAAFKQRLRDHILTFKETELITTDSTLTHAQQDDLGLKLKTHFNGFNQVDQ